RHGKESRFWLQSMLSTHPPDGIRLTNIEAWLIRNQTKFHGRPVTPLSSELLPVKSMKPTELPEKAESVVASKEKKIPSETISVKDFARRVLRSPVFSALSPSKRLGIFDSILRSVFLHPDAPATYVLRDCGVEEDKFGDLEDLTNKKIVQGDLPDKWAVRN